MSAPHWMPFYIRDFIVDTQQLSTMEIGIYLQLLMFCWQHGRLPAEQRRLALIAHCDTRVWHQRSKFVLGMFKLHEDGTRTHKRVDAELAKAAEISAIKRQAAEVRKAKVVATINVTDRECDKNATMVEGATVLYGKSEKPNDFNDALMHVHLQSQSHVEEKKESKKENPPTPLERGSKRKKPRTEINPNWKLSEVDIAYAKAHGWCDERIAIQGERFRDSAKAHGRIYADWSAAWRNWVISPIQKSEESRVFQLTSNANNRQPSMWEEKQRETKDVLKRLREYSSQPTEDCRNGHQVNRLLPIFNGQRS